MWPRSDSGLAAALSETFTDTAWRYLILLGYDILPASTVAKGDWWESRTGPVLHGPGKLSIENRSTLKEVRQGGPALVLLETREKMLVVC